MSSKGSVTVRKPKMEKVRDEQDTKVKGLEANNSLKELSGSDDSEEEADEIQDDELDLSDVSSVSEANGSEDDGSDAHERGEEDEEEGDDFPKKKKSKKSKHDDGSNDFSSAVNAILSSHLKAYDRKDPIMARNKKVLKKNESDKLEQQARRVLTTERKKLLNKARKKDIIPIASGENQNGEEIRAVLEKETKLRKIAQKGVVKLFNAILSTQVKTEKEIATTMGDIKNRKERETLITEVSKEKFLDLVKAAGEDN
ncbi:rRNA-processing protein RRP15 NDAI_0B05780 [Naumovozyma dairenensis CBS 421]|uniref:Ribosomal RNA-processing protein 15 n=1 Tax=Naumovozyma dairenensis (strain ATCC 10597 / BCRC 20456 / CBS 421 / NBRC 0211 / NRRL Y-12639) TaxID=1071378 RepID=G0W750_NAUDC|nr:hypothetical protein NDAI_0B05780 [Naumovozyma dairenensis CBS 421]CCD23611.1 hypothetical protein NDAI_0B05780 [Naumovozyma dairenensis CBS 421]